MIWKAGTREAGRLKVVTVKRDKVGPAFGTASDELMLTVNRALTVFLGIA